MVAQPEPDRELGLTAIEHEWCRRRFARFLRYWQFVNRETGEALCFGNILWPGQERLAAAMEKHRWLFALKAGKLGFTELECAYDGWRALFAAPHARVHLFSKNGEAARELLQYVRHGLTNLPDDLRPDILAEIPGGDTVRSLRLRPPAWAAAGPDDVRTIISYNTERHVGVDLSCNHSHIDELWAMPFPRETWSAVASTVAPEGTCHIISRGGGQSAFTTELWEQTQEGNSRLHLFFEPWMGRPDRDQRWYEAQAATFIGEHLARFAPETPEDALYSTDVQDFVHISMWDACKDESLPPFNPGDKTPTVVGVDAATTGDCFGIVAVTRMPGAIKDVAVRAVRKWDPPKGGAIDYWEPEAFLRTICKGGCALGHPQYAPFKLDEAGAAKAGKPVCPACRDQVLVPGYNVVCIVYDNHQLVHMMQTLRREAGIWCEEFSQGLLRLKADRGLYDMIINRQLHHDGNEPLRQQIRNSQAQLQKQQDSTMRIVKKATAKKVDLVVALSMAAYQCRYLLLS